MKPKRPFSITILAILIFGFGVFHLARFGDALANWAFLSNLLTVSPAYLAASGLVWGLAGIVVAVLVWLGVMWSRWVVIVVGLLFSVHYWLDEIFIVERTGLAQNWPFAAAINLVLLILIVWTLFRPRAVSWFSTALSREGDGEAPTPT
jgi:hypothetical protein